MLKPRCLRLDLVAVVAGVLLAACSGTSNTSDGGTHDAGLGDLGPAGGPVSGDPDTHCSLPGGGDGGINMVRQAACAPPDAGVGIDVGTSTTTDSCNFGATNHNTSANDDDCKYHVSFSSTPVYRNFDVDFDVSVTRLADGSAVTGAAINPEVFLASPDPTAACPPSARPAPNTTLMKSEPMPGHYRVGPIQFDQPGDWTVRFHFFEDCFDAPESPHGHAAFLIRVP
jgi:hypothetical protein